MAKDFTHTDYYSASLTRLADLKHLRTNKDSIIFSTYCAGVSIECMFRAYIAKYTREFDEKHNLEKLFEKSLLSNELDENEKKKIINAVKKANKIWNNDLRYVSEKRMKRKIAHENIKTEFKDVNKYLEKFKSEIFDSTEFIIKTGVSKWT